MKRIKQFSKILVLACLVLFLTACGEKNITGSLEELMTKVYTFVPEDKLPALENTVITEENIERFLGTKDIEYEEALASEPMISSIAHSVILIRTKKNADIESIKTKIRESINPRKWICVGVERDEVIIKNKGNLIIVIVAENNREEIDKGFENL